MLRLTRPATLSQAVYDEYVNNVPEGDFYFNLKRPLIVPHSSVTQLLLRTDVITGPVQVFVNGLLTKTLTPWVQGTTRVDTRSAKGFVIEVSFSVVLDLGENEVEVRAPGEQPYQLFLTALTYASILSVFASNLERFIERPMDTAQRILTSPWSAPFLKHKLGTEHLLPDVVGTHALRMHAAGLFMRPGTEASLTNYIRGLVYNTPATELINNAKFIDFDLQPTRYSDRTRNRNVHVWLPNPDLARWLAFGRYIDNHPQQYEVEDFDFLSTDLRRPTALEPIRFDPEREGRPNFEKVLEHYPGNQFIRFCKSSEHRIKTRRWTYGINQSIAIPLGTPTFLGGLNLDGSADLAENDGVDLWAHEDRDDSRGFLHQNVGDLLLGSPSPRIPMSSTRTGWYPLGNTIQKGPQTQHLGFHHREMIAPIPAVPPIPIVLPSFGLNAGGATLPNPLDLSFPTSQLGELLIWTLYSIDQPIVSLSPGLTMLIPEQAIPTASGTVYISTVYHIQSTVAPIPLEVTFAAPPAFVGIMSAAVLGSSVSMPLGEANSTIDNNVSSVAVNYTNSGSMMVAISLGVHSAPFSVPPDPFLPSESTYVAPPVYAYTRIDWAFSPAIDGPAVLPSYTSTPSIDSRYTHYYSIRF